jgi:hypothetical protein
MHKRHEMFIKQAVAEAKLTYGKVELTPCQRFDLSLFEADSKLNVVPEIRSCGLMH